MVTRRPVDFRAVRDAIRPYYALLLFGWRPASTAGVQVRGPCPFHKSKSATSRTLSVSDRVVFCHKCKATGDAVWVYQQFTGLDPLAAAVELCNRLGRRVPYL